MELGSKVTALEEEIAVLKGEIKTILEEVRTAVLARENPFAVDTYEPRAAATPAPAPAPTPEPAAEPEQAPKVIRLNALPDPEPEDDLPAPAPRNGGAGEPGRVRHRETATAANKRRWSVGSLATLMAWTQDVTSRMDANDLDIVLSMARYGGLIEEDLETTLTKLAAPLFAPSAEKRRVGVSDYLLALRELSALIEDAEDNYGGVGSLRRAS
jgi:hypothetical protein